MASSTMPAHGETWFGWLWNLWCWSEILHVILQFTSHSVSKGTQTIQQCHHTWRICSHCGFFWNPHIYCINISLQQNYFESLVLQIIAMALTSQRFLLNRVEFGNNVLADEGTALAFIQTFHAFPQLTSKIILFSSVTSRRTLILAISELIWHCSGSLEYLDIANDNNLDNDTRLHMAEFLESNSTLSSLWVSNIPPNRWDQIPSLLCDTIIIASTFLSTAHYAAMAQEFQIFLQKFRLTWQ